MLIAKHLWEFPQIFGKCIMHLNNTRDKEKIKNTRKYFEVKKIKNSSSKYMVYL